MIDNVLEMLLLCAVVCSSTRPLPVEVKDVVDRVVSMHRNYDFQYCHEFSVCTTKLLYRNVSIIMCTCR